MITPALKSYLRHVLIALVPLLTVAESQPKHYLFAVALAVVGPLIRALDPNDTEIVGLNGDKEA